LGDSAEGFQGGGAGRGLSSVDLGRGSGGRSSGNLLRIDLFGRITRRQENPTQNGLPNRGASKLPGAYRPWRRRFAVWDSGGTCARGGGFVRGQNCAEADEEGGAGKSSGRGIGPLCMAAWLSTTQGGRVLAPWFAEASGRERGFGLLLWQWFGFENSGPKARSHSSRKPTVEAGVTPGGSPRSAKNRARWPPPSFQAEGPNAKERFPKPSGQNIIFGHRPC